MRIIIEYCNYLLIPEQDGDHDYETEKAFLKALIGKPASFDRVVYAKVGSK